MKQVSVIHPSLANHKNVKHSFDLKIDEVKVKLALINCTIGIEDFDLNKFDSKCVIVKKKAISLNWRDKAIILEANNFILNNNDGISMVPIGSEFVGEIIELGKGVRDFQIGDRVIGNSYYPSKRGAYPGLPSNYASLEFEVLHSSKLIGIPNSMNNDIAAGFMIGAQTSYGILNRLNIRKSNSILVTAGTSVTSLFILNVLKKYTSEIYALTTSDLKKEKLLKLGLKGVLVIDKNDNLKDNEELGRIAKKINGFDIVIDPFADIFLGKLIKYMGINSKYISCGLYNQYSHYTGNESSYQGEAFYSLLAKVIRNNITLMGHCLGKSKDLELAIKDFVEDNFDFPYDSSFLESQIEHFFYRTFNDDLKFGKVILKYEN